MTICPFCHFANEDGALFCDQCKSDLAGAAPPVVPAAVVLEAVPVLAEHVPLAAEVVAPHAEVDLAGAAVLEAMPVPVAAVAAVPVVEATPVAAPPGGVPPASANAALATPAATPPPLPAAAAPDSPRVPLAPGAQPRLIVMRGLKRNVEYPIYEGLNFIGRADDKPVDIDLEDQEPEDRVWCSRQHACISFENNLVEIEDLNSANGTYVNRQKIYPGQKSALAPNDIVQIGHVQMKLII